MNSHRNFDKKNLSLKLEIFNLYCLFIRKFLSFILDNFAISLVQWRIGRTCGRKMGKELGKMPCNLVF
jgi:hypothetical protein